MAKSKLFNLAHFSQVAMPEGNMTLAWFLTDVVGVKADRWYTHIHRSEQGKHQGIVTQFLSDKSRRGTNNKILINYSSAPKITDTIYGYRFFAVSMIVLSKQDLAKNNDNIAEVVITYQNFSEYYNHMEEVAEKAKSDIKKRRQDKNKEDKDGPTIPVIEKTMRFLKKLLDHLKKQEDKKKDDHDSSSGNDSSKSPLEHDSANNKKSSGDVNPGPATDSAHSDNNNDNSPSGNDHHKSFPEHHSDDNDNKDGHTDEAKQQCVHNFATNEAPGSGSYGGQMDDSDNGRPKNLADTAVKKAEELVDTFEKFNENIRSENFKIIAFWGRCRDFPKNIDSIKNDVDGLLKDKTQLNDAQDRIVGILGSKILKKYNNINESSDPYFSKYNRVWNTCNTAINKVKQWDPNHNFPADYDIDYDNKSVENSDKNSEEKRKISAPKSEGSENKSNNDDTDTQKKKTRSNDDDDEKIKTQSDKDDEKKAEDKVEQSFDDEDEEEGTFEEEDDSIAVPAAVDDAKKLIEDFKKVIATIGTEQFIGEKFRDARRKFSDNINGIPSRGSTEGLKEAKKQIIALIREFIEKEITPKLSKATGKNKTRYERAKKACDEALDLVTRWHFEEEEEEGDFKQDDENGKSEDDDGSGSGGENVAGSEDVKWAVGEAKKLIQEFKDMEKIVKTDKFKSSDFKKTCENFPTDIDNIFQADDSKLEQEEDMESAQKQITDLIQGYIDSIESVGGPTDTTMASTGYSFTQNRAVHQACDKAIEKVKAWAPPKH